jgi:hypothetical protein
VPCGRYDAGTFTASGFIGSLSLQWTSLSVFPNDGSALAGGSELNIDPNANGSEPMLVHAVCGLEPTIARFRIPYPLIANQATAPLVPADATTGKTTTVAANAFNDAWAATTFGTLTNQLSHEVDAERPHVYRWTDGQPPDAPAGDDHESRPSVFTLDPPVYVQPPPVVVIQRPSRTVHQRGKTKTKKLAPAVFAVHNKLIAGRNGTLTLYITFRLRRPVTIGVVALRGHRIVSSSGLKRFRGRRGQLALKLDRKHWPTSIRFVTPKKKRP